MKIDNRAIHKVQVGPKKMQRHRVAACNRAFIFPISELECNAYIKYRDQVT